MFNGATRYREFSANILAGMARQLLCLHRPADAQELVRIARESATGDASPAMRAMLLTREAWVYARSGRLTAFRRATSRAEDALRDAHDGDGAPQWIQYFDEAELAGVTGGRLLDAALAHPKLAGEAAAHIARAIELRPENALRSSALDHLGLAQARLVQGEVDEAMRVGHEAVDIVERTQSHRVRTQLADLYQQSKPYDAGPSVRDLRTRVKDLIADDLVSS